MVLSNRDASKQRIFTGGEIAAVTVASIGGGAMMIHNEAKMLNELGPQHKPPLKPKVHPHPHIKVRL